jgi:hypothetical protein
MHKSSSDIKRAHSRTCVIKLSVPGAVPKPRTASAWRPDKLCLANVISPGSMAHLRMPPMPPHAKFNEVYQIWLLLDKREQFDRTAAGRGALRNESLALHMEQLKGLVGGHVETRQLVVGDAAWVARCWRSLPGGPTCGVLCSLLCLCSMLVRHPASIALYRSCSGTNDLGSLGQITVHDATGGHLRLSSPPSEHSVG